MKTMAAVPAVKPREELYSAVDIYNNCKVLAIFSSGRDLTTHNALAVGLVR